ncbi:MAG: hypothetical protein ACHP8A_17385 [Terriglobales bacterium]
MKPFESTGSWFVPPDHDKIVPGTLRFSPEDGLSLTLLGAFQESWGMQAIQYPVINGIITDSPYGKRVSLFDCFATKLRFGTPGIALETIRANHAFVGSSLIEAKEIEFDEAAVYFDDLAFWLNVSGLSTDMAANEVIARWHQHDPLESTVPGAEISTTSFFNHSSSGAPPSITMEEVPGLLIHLDTPLTHEKLHEEYVGALIRLMTFIADRPAEFNRYMLFSGNDEEPHRTRLDRIYAPMGYQNSEERQTKSDARIIFTIRDIPGGFPVLIPAWFDFVKKHPDFCSMFFSYAYVDTGYVESRFLFRMLAAQLLAREEYPDDPILTGFEEFHKELIGPPDKSMRKLISLVLPSFSQLALPAMLSKLLDERWGVLEQIVSTEKLHFIESLFSTFDHVLNRGKPGSSAILGTNLYWLTERLTAVIKLCVLKSLGLTDEAIRKISATNPRLSHLKQSKQPWSTVE